jgi:hypothetical protein
VIGTTSSEIWNQLRDRYSKYKCCLNVATYINGKFTMGTLKSFLQSQSFVFDVCITPRLFRLFSNSTVCHSHADIPWNPSALLQQNNSISRKQILTMYFKIILIELMYISILFLCLLIGQEHCHLFVFDSFTTR